MEQVFNKLVRDNVPEIISSKGEGAITRILEDDEFKKALYKKLLEEANEVITATNKEDTLVELADVLEVLKTIAELNGATLEEIEKIAKQKKLKRGGFQKHVFLEKTY